MRKRGYDHFFPNLSPFRSLDPLYFPFILFTRLNIWFMVSTLLSVKEKGELVNGWK
jgi:hypothetical protein